MPLLYHEVAGSGPMDLHYMYIGRNLSRNALTLSRSIITGDCTYCDVRHEGLECIIVSFSHCSDFCVEYAIFFLKLTLLSQ